MFYKYKYLIDWEYKPIYKGDLIKWFIRPYKTFKIDTIYTYHGNPGCHHDRIKLIDINTGEEEDASMIMFCNCNSELYRNGKWNKVIVVEK